MTPWRLIVFTYIYNFICDKFYFALSLSLSLSLSLMHMCVNTFSCVKYKSTLTFSTVLYEQGFSKQGSPIMTLVVGVWLDVINLYLHGRKKKEKGTFTPYLYNFSLIGFLFALPFTAVACEVQNLLWSTMSWPSQKRNILWNHKVTIIFFNRFIVHSS